MANTINPIKLVALFTIGYLHLFQYFQLTFLMEGTSLNKSDNAWVTETMFGELLCIFNLYELILYDLLIVNFEHLSDGHLSDEHF